MKKFVIRYVLNHPEILKGTDFYGVWRLKQALAKPARYYGDGGTIHNSDTIDVVTDNGKVVQVWFRCQPLKFHQTLDDRELLQGSPVNGVEVFDEKI